MKNNEKILIEINYLKGLELMPHKEKDGYKNIFELEMNNITLGNFKDGMKIELDFESYYLFRSLDSSNETMFNFVFKKDDSIFALNFYEHLEIEDGEDLFFYENEKGLLKRIRFHNGKEKYNYLLKVYLNHLLPEIKKLDVVRFKELLRKKSLQ